MLSPGQAYFETTVAIATALLLGTIATFIVAGVTGDRLLSIGGGCFISILVGGYLAARLWRLTRPLPVDSGVDGSAGGTR